VVETNVHYPTDTNLLFDAIRKTIQICAELSSDLGLTEWRQSAYNIQQFKRSYRKIQKLKHQGNAGSNGYTRVFHEERTSKGVTASFVEPETWIGGVRQR